MPDEQVKAVLAFIKTLESVNSDFFNKKE